MLCTNSIYRQGLKKSIVSLHENRTVTERKGKPMRRVALHNLGCKVNAYETEAMEQTLKEAGYEIVPFQEEADVYIINTCSVTNIADRKSRQMLHRAKKRNPDSVVVAAGCYVQAAKVSLKDDPSVDLMIGNNKKIELIKILEDYLKEKDRTQRSHILDIEKTTEYERLNIDKIGDHTRAFIKIQDGCNQFCSYCIIPYTRGRVRSRSPKEVVEEAKRLAENGYQEMVLTGIHLSSYGLDFLKEERMELLELLQKLDEISGLKRIRLGSLEPRIMTEDFVKGLAGIKSICPHFHLSLQSGCNETLKRMNRHYTTDQYEESCRRLRTWFTQPAITTDIIAGFPQETEKEFLETVEFLKRIQFYEMHVFKYSRRANTKAAGMEGQIPEEEKTRRSNVLLELDKKMSRQYRESLLGQKREVLFEEKISVNGADYLAGYTREYVKAGIPWKEGLSHKLETNQIITSNLKSMVNNEFLSLE